MADDDVYRERYSTVYPVYDGGYDDAPEPSGEYHDISRGAWRSAIIKFVRIGWLDGLEEAARHTSESDVKYLLKRQVWEDLMPAPDELEQVYRAIEEFDLERYLSFETHHSKQLVGGDDDGEPMTEPVLGNLFWHAHEEVDDGPKMGLAAALDVYVPNIVFDCLWAWNEVKEHIPSGGRREVCTEPWEGLPTIVCDEHTKEGRIWGVEATLVSGHPRMHRELSKRVHLTGWQAVWDEVFSSPVVHNNQQDMFDDA